MKSKLKAKCLRIDGMTCASCQNKIEKKLRATAGIESAEVSYGDGSAAVIYDPDLISLSEIESVVKGLDYRVINEGQRFVSNRKAIGMLIIVLALFMLLKQFGLTNIFNIFPTAEAGMDYGMLFIIGILTSVHCVTMCGGINLSQCIPYGSGGGNKLKTFKPSFLYNLGRVLSYTIIGGIVGALGSVLTLSGSFRGLIQLIAGVFMIVMGINMLGLFPSLRKIAPRMPNAFARKIDAKKGESKSPLIVGLLNGLLPCGPLQAMQIYALSSGSPVKGALSMLLFSLGTVPLMFGLGALSSALSKKFTRKAMTVGAALVVILGLSMLSQGWNLSGISLAFPPAAVAEAPPVLIEDGYQIVKSTLQSGRYPAITVQAGIPVKWTIDAPQGSINGCNNRIFIPEFALEYQFATGENIIEFTPRESGRFPYSCWMGMIRSSITVVEEGAEISAEDLITDDAESGYPFYEDEYGQIPEPAAANVIIPTDTLAIAEVGTINVRGEEYPVQRVAVELTDEGYSPAVIVVQGGVDVEWIVNNTSSAAAHITLLVPYYNTSLNLQNGENQLYLFPTEYFTFSNGDNTFYGYVKVVDDLSVINEEAIKAEAGAYKTLIYPPEVFASGGAPKCH